MKKILGLLGSIALVVPASLSIESCKNEISGSVKKLEFAKGKSVNDLIEFVSDGYIDEEDKKILDDSVCLSEYDELSDEERRILKGVGDIDWFHEDFNLDDIEASVKIFNDIKNLFKNLNNIHHSIVVDEIDYILSFFSVDDARKNDSSFTLKLIQIYLKRNEKDKKGFTFRRYKVLYKTTIDLNQIK